MNKLAVGIPFFASKNIAPLLLCLKSLDRYSSLEYDLFILLNCSDPSQYQGFCFPEVLRIANEVHVKYYSGDDNAYKQTLIDWIADSHFEYDYMFILHSDIFLYKNGVMERMLDALVGTDNLISYWDVPAQLFQSTYHLSESSKLTFMVAPRVRSWLMCICVEKYRKFRDNCPLAKCLFLGFAKNTGDPQMQGVWEWFYKQCSKKERRYLEQGNAIIDHGGVLRYYLSIGKISGVVLGKDSNPNFDSMSLYYNPYGYVHIGQTDPNRYNDSFYSKKLLQVRMNEIKKLLNENYNIELNDDF